MTTRRRGSLDDLEQDALTAARAARADHRAYRADDPALLADHFTKILFMHFKFEDMRAFSRNLVDLNIVRVVHQLGD